MEFNKNTYLAEELDLLPTQQLKQMLSTELNRDPPNGQRVRTILRVLEAREDERTEIDGEEVEAACDRYRSYWEKTAADQRSKATGVRKFVLRAASVAVVVGMLCFVAPQVAKADSFREMLIQWSESVFELFGAAYTDEAKVEYVFRTENPGLQQVYDAVEELGVTSHVVPSWIPEGCELFELKNTKTRVKEGVLAVFTDGDICITFAVDVYDPELAHEYLKDIPAPLVYEYDGVEHNITSNDEKTIAVWAIENIGVSISADCQEDTLYKMIDSIYTVEAD